MTLDEGAGVPLRDHAVGPYVLRERIAKGGMGEVFRAHDRHLDREVAIKILPLELTSSAERLERLQREARLLASLNHRNIATVHGLEISGGVVALVMELLDGTTLAERLSQGRLPVAEVLDIAGQLADGLEAAHAKGIIHRDLKPANVMVTSAGVVKILDFGIAKHVVGASPTAVVDAPTRAGTTTDEGAIVGTAAYMSPEQARGKAIDKRTDLWAYGCVLYEMLAGRAAFAGETAADTVSRILDRDPDWHDLPSDTPVAVTRLLRRCLVKQPAKRWRDIGDARIELDDLTTDASAPAVARPRDS